ncbi:MAG: hypothetical protein BM562_07045 [Alphaproteobacteria bacterium MedPE-SWcel]|nr:MAG: hypothetical protein BM562_07045 [Alphaproteobacteria bacterium MedPE-SWcel]
MPDTTAKRVDRVQTGVRIEKRLLKVLKALAAHKEITLSNLLEGMILHSLENRPAFSEDTLEFIEAMRVSFKLDISPEDSHSLQE